MNATFNIPRDEDLQHFNIIVSQGLLKLVDVSLFGRKLAIHLYRAIVEGLAAGMSEEDFAHLRFNVRIVANNGDWVPCLEIDELAFGIDPDQELPPVTPGAAILITGGVTLSPDAMEIVK